MKTLLRRALPVVAVLALSSAPPAAAQVVEYFHLDALGSVRAVTNASGAILEQHDYMPFGEEWCAPSGCATPPAGQARRYTGKERDTETGLYYFGARYYTGSVGRFTTVDPLYTWAKNMVDPQRWNRYSYGRDNPLRYVDPDGRYICSGDDCKQIEKARQADLGSADGDVRRGAEAYGEPGVDNGVTVSFGNPGVGWNGATVSRLVPTQDGETAQVKSEVTLRRGLRGTTLAEVVAHEGSHVADANDFGATVHGTSYDPKRNIFKYDSEFRAYLVTNSVYANKGLKVDIGHCGKGRCIIGDGVPIATVQKTIDQFLADPANGYQLSRSCPLPPLFQGLRW